MNQEFGSHSLRARRRRGQRGAVSALVVGGSAVAAAALVGGGVVAANQLSGGGDQPADVLPDSTLAYTSVDLDPSASQKIDLVRLLRRFPDFEEQTGISSDKEDLRRTMAEAALDESGCDVDYGQDIEPWLGDRAAFAGLPGTDGGRPQAAAVLQVTDSSAAEDGLAKLADCASGSGSDAPGAFAFTGDYVVIAQTQDVADAVVAGGESAPLSQNEQYVQDMDRLGDPGLASFWVDVPAVVDAAKQSGADLTDMGLSGLDAGNTDSVYGTLRAGSDNIELALLSSGEQVLKNGSSPVGELPASTLAAMSMSGLGQSVDGQWDKLHDTFEQVEPGAFDRQVATFEQQSGLQLPEDLATLLGDNVTVALDSEGLDPQTLSAPDAGADSVDAGVRFTGDTAAIQDVVDRIRTALQKQGAPFDLISTDVEGGVVVATNDDYATAMADGGLSGVDGFTGAVGAVDDSAAVFYLDLDQVTTIAEQFAEQSGDDTSFVGYLEPVRAVGVNVSVGDGYSQATVRLTFDDAG